VKLEIGLDKTFSPPTTGYFALVATPVGKLTAKRLTLDPADRKLLVDGVHYTDKSYLVFCIESTQERSDWGEIPDLKASYAAIRAAVVGNDQTKANETFATFQRQAIVSPDLTSTDATRLIGKVRALLATAFAGAGTAGESMSLPEFHDVGLYT
jgi:hypothetical protein